MEKLNGIHTKILIVDDEEMIRELLTVNLTPADGTYNVQIIQAENGQQALDLLEKHQDTDVILLDINMPVMNGLQTLEITKRDPRFSHIPVCVLSVVKSTVLKALELGASDFIPKPFNNEELQLRIFSLILTKRKLEATEKAKVDFLCTISHELRTPMNGIIGMAELLKMDSLNHKQAEYVEFIGQSADQMMNLINDIISFMGSENSLHHLPAVPFLLRETVNASIHSLIPQAAEKGLALEIDIHPDIPDHLLGYPEKLQQIFICLINNAVKFTSSGKVSLAITPGAVSDTGIQINCTISDTGVGIALEDQARIFEPFTQVDGTKTRKFGGLGIGLSLANRLVQLFGGSMKVDSTPGGGSTFGFDIKCTLDPAHHSAHVSAEPDSTMLSCSSQPNIPSDGPRGNPLSILVAEELLTNRTVLRKILESQGHRVTIADNGERAVSIWKQEEFDLIFMDLHMPVMDGYEATRRIREAEAKTGKRIPIIAMTCDSMKNSKHECRQTGMDNVLVKPVAKLELITLLEHYGYDTTGRHAEPIQPSP